jgi:YHS domain-containing protein
MNRLATILAAASLTIAAGALAQAHADHQDKQAAATTQPAAKPLNTKCPVSGEDIDPAVTKTYQGKTVAFCCKDCIESFEKDPEKYMKKLK